MNKKENIITLENIGTFKIARIYKRFLAFLIDVILVHFYTLFFYFSLKERDYPFLPKEDLITFYIDFVFSFWTYLIFCYRFLKGKTVGKLLFKIRVISEDGKNINIKRCFLRSTPIVLFFCWAIFPKALVLLHYINFGFSSLYLLNKEPYKSKGKTFWDLASRTIVIEE